MATPTDSHQDTSTTDRDRQQSPREYTYAHIRMYIHIYVFIYRLHVRTQVSTHVQAERETPICVWRVTPYSLIVLTEGDPEHKSFLWYGSLVCLHVYSADRWAFVTCVWTEPRRMKTGGFLGKVSN